MTSPELRPPSGPVDAERILGAFLDHVSALGLELYPAQEEAVFALLDANHVVLSTPTGSGKSMVAMAMMFKALCEGKTAYYTCPVKALVNEKFFDLCRTFGAKNVGLMTGDATVNPGAPLICSTAEILSNQTLRGGRATADYVVMDEFHYYGDKERGIAWQIPLIALPKTTFLLMSATLGDMSNIITRLEKFTGRQVVHVRGMQRPVPLEFTYKEELVHETVMDLVRSNRAPIYMVNFTQRSAAEQAQALTSLDITSKEEKNALKVLLAKERFSSPYGKELLRFLRAGIGLHHAGLLPRYRRLVERLAQQGLLKVVSGTDTLGVGVNIPIRTVLFTQLCKYDGTKDAILPARDFHQVAGRAGRKGFDDQGYVVALAPAHIVENKRLSEKSNGKKFTKRQPPKKGFVHWDQTTFTKLIDATPEPLQSQFQISHGLLLSVLQSEDADPKRGAGYRRLLDLIAQSHDSDVLKRRHKRNAAKMFRGLRNAGLILLQRDERARNPYPVASTELQHEFSLNQTLGLYLVETLELLDPALETYAFDVLALVESILENPRTLLIAQLDRAKDERMNELRAEGADYEARMEGLESVQYPKPNAEFIYETFNAFAERHPWVGQENIAPKGIARELLEHHASFNDYVRSLAVARSEGVLLRYLTDAYKTLVQSVPRKFHTDLIEDMALTLGAVVRTVDASLLEEWEAMMDPAAAAARLAEGVALEEAMRKRANAKKPLWDDERALMVRVRTELHRLLGALARKDWEEALDAIWQPTDAAAPWTGPRLNDALAPFFAQYGTLLATPAARANNNTTLRAVDERRFEATQRLCDPERHDDWALVVTIDLTSEARAGVPEDAPLIMLDSISGI
ncbi:MAG: DUF3516 domain-containing protein [Deltaproteobacteria bacterium]|nr:DUF3516 domain-containing protein [Deltaproteobacteria bacterium]